MEALAYTQQVVNEALRLYPPGWLLSRRTIEPDVLAGFRCRRAPTCCCRSTCCIAIRSTGGPGGLPAGALRAGARGRAPALRLHAVCRRPAPLHRRDVRPVRNADAPVQASPATTACATCRTNRCELEAQINLRTRYPLHMRLERAMMQKVKTLTEMMEANRSGRRAASLSGGRERFARRLLRANCTSARWAFCITCSAGRAARRQADPVPRQQRAVHRRLLGRGAGRHHAGAGRARHQRRASPQAAAHRAQARQALPLHRRKRSLERIGAFAAQVGEHGACSRNCARAPSWSMSWMTSPAPASVQQRAAGGHGLHPVLLRLHQRAQGRGAHARATSSPTARGSPRSPASPRTTSACRGCR